MDQEQLDWTGIQTAYDEMLYPQMALLSESQFKSALTSRGIRPFPNGLEHMIKAGIIHPLKDDPLQFHPFQIWLVSAFFRRLSIDLTGQFCYSGFDLEQGYKNLLRQWESLVKDLREFSVSKPVAEFFRILPLLFRLESYYLPRVRGARPGMVHFVGLDPDGWAGWRENQKLGMWLEEASLSIDDVKQWHGMFLREANKLDPASGWYLLIRSAEYSKREKLRGSLRLAYDFYEIAELLRLYISDVSGDSVSKEWDASGHPDTPWAKRLYAVNEINIGSRDLLSEVEPISWTGLVRS